MYAGVVAEMPEGPEIRLAADRIARVLEGQRLHEVLIAPHALRQFTPRLEGATVTRIDTRGKAMLTRFDNGLTLYSHNQLYGRWYVRARGDLPRTRRSLRVALHTAMHSALLYSATDIEVLDAAGLESHAFLSRLGPDILDPELRWHAVASRLNEQRFRARSLASLYLDQKFLAGIGNYLRTEILYFAQLSHSRRPMDISRADRHRLARHTLDVARRSYRTGGITNPEKRVRARKASGETKRGAYRFAAFARDGRSCDVCGETILREEANARRIYFCPRCQASPREDPHGQV